MPSDFVVDRWVSDGEGSSLRDFPFLHAGWSYAFEWQRNRYALQHISVQMRTPVHEVLAHRFLPPL
jgi:hypothetical protein